MNKLKSFYFLLIYGTLFSATPELSTITHIDVLFKDNGIICELNFSSTVNYNHASGWYSQTGWFYITILNTTLDSLALPMIPKSKYIHDTQFDKIGESIQISLKLTIKPDNYEFYQKSNMKQLFLSIRTPITPLVTHTSKNAKTNIDDIDSEILSEPSFITIKKEHNPIVSSGYVLGISLSISGIVQEGKDNNNSWELPVGIGFIIITYLWDNYFYNSEPLSIDSKINGKFINQIK